MCLTAKKKIFTWGEGQYGKLGHGNEEDLLKPTEITMLSNMRVIDMSAGDAHSAAVTQNKKLYMWGNGDYGRLGTGFENSEKSPTLVEDLNDKEVVRVSCGAFHTLAMTINGRLWAWGQDKYNKLGLGKLESVNKNRSQPAEVFAMEVTQGDKIE